MPEVTLDNLANVFYVIIVALVLGAGKVLAAFPSRKKAAVAEADRMEIAGAIIDNRKASEMIEVVSKLIRVMEASGHGVDDCCREISSARQELVAMTREMSEFRHSFSRDMTELRHALRK